MAGRVFNLKTYGSKGPKDFNYIVITPKAVEPEVVQAAWSYAVRYSAKGLDLPDYDEAIKLLQSRHGSWTLINTGVSNISVKLKLADNDKAE